MIEPPLLFISYSHLDDECRKRLRIHLTPLERGRVLRVFDDTELDRDTGWRDQLFARLREAELVILLVSADFLHSGSCFVEEWPIAKGRWKAKKAIVTFALIDPCDWINTDIGELQGVPAHGNLLPETKRGAAKFWDDITNKLRKDSQQICNRRSSTKKKGKKKRIVQKATKKRTARTTKKGTKRAP